jgi:hypothetical protein
MKEVTWHGRDIRVDTVPDPQIENHHELPAPRRAREPTIVLGRE